MIGKVSADDVRKAVDEMHIRQWALRRCSMCNFPLRYIFAPQGVFFDSNCDCTSYYTNPQARSLEDVAECFNIQSSDEVRQRMWNEFICSGESK